MSGFLINVKSFIFTSCIISLAVILSLDFWYKILPTNKAILFIYLLAIFVLSLWITFKLIQKRLKLSKPCEDCIPTVNLYPGVGNKPNREQDTGDCVEEQSKMLEIDKKKLKLFLESVEVLLRNNCKDYSLDNCLVAETVSELDNLSIKCLKTLQFINFKEILHGTLIIFLRHVKEYKRCVKRTNTNGGNIEDNFRFMHIGSENGQLFETFILNLTSEVLSHFLNGELYNSLSGQCLAGAIAKKVTMARIVDCAKPGYLNYTLLNACASAKSKANLRLDEYGYISVCDVDHTDNINLTQLTSGWKRNHSRGEIIFKEPDDIEGNIYNEATSNEKSTEPIYDQRYPTEDIVDSKMNGNHKQDEIDRCVDIVDRPNNNCHPSENSSFEDITLYNDKVTVRPKTISEPVKIYQSKSATKTWRNSSDLECISLGQDLLELDNIDPDIQLNNFIDNSLWTDNDFTELDDKSEKADEVIIKSNDDDHTMFGTACDKVFTSSHSIQQGAATLVTNTVKHLSTTTKELGEEISHATASTFSNMKELQQTTVNNVIKPVSQATTNAIHKIEDLQDEAAGMVDDMVEGLLDFGKAGLRKGLRLTGLDEEHPDVIVRTDPNHHAATTVAQVNRRKLIGLGKVKQQQQQQQTGGAVRGYSTSSASSGVSTEDSGRGGGRVAAVGKGDSTSSGEGGGTVWINPLLTSKSPSFDGEILLEMSPTDSGIATNIGIPEIPSLEINSAIDSPDTIEYEDAPDLATTTARLRSLLAQRTESALSTPALSPMPIEEKSSLLPTPIDPSSGSYDDLSDVDGALPSMYTKWARTATGVFHNTLNTIKTALPGNPDSGGNVKGGEDVTDYNNQGSEWMYVSYNEAKIHKRIQKIISERKEFCTIDKAYEAVEHTMDQMDTHKKSIQFEQDELDEFDLTIPITKVLYELLCELAGDVYPFIVKESFVRATLLTFGATLERRIRSYTDSVAAVVAQALEPISADVGVGDKQMALVMTVNELVEMIVNDSVPDLYKSFLGEDSLHSVFKLFVESLQSQRLNEDVALQIVELLAAKTVDAVRRSSQTTNR